MTNCVICNKPTLIHHYMRYFTDDCGNIVLGGHTVKGPICQLCWYNIGDSIYGKPILLVQEHKDDKS